MTKKTITRLGGRRDNRAIRRKWKNAQEALLGELMIAFGGPTDLSKLLSDKLKKNITKQDFLNWRKRGGVPLDICQTIADGLKISPYALNFSRMSAAAFGPGMSWKAAVRSCKMLSDDSVGIILSYKDPELIEKRPSYSRPLKAQIR